MNLKYLDTIELEDYKQLLISAEWKVLSDKQLSNALKNTMFISCCVDNEKVVGVARIVGDYSVHGVLCDVVVLKEYRHLGIGRKLVNNIKDKVYEMLEENEQFLIELLPAYGKREFYLGCGFKYKPEYMDGMYLWIKK